MQMLKKAGLLASICSLILLPFNWLQGSPLKPDEEVRFFPTSANQLHNDKDKDSNEWNVPIHSWVFEKEQNAISRKFTQMVFSELIEGLDVSEEGAKSPMFRDRLMWFLVDNERNKKIEISIAGRVETLNLTEANGHSKTEKIISSDAILGAIEGEWLTFKVNDPGEQKREFTGSVQLIPEKGVSVISDIDDTIKISEVLDKKALIRNTFAKPYLAAEGMPAYYQKLKEQGAYFHYVSASPWQIYPSLKPFMDKHYPQGTVSLRNFRIKDSSLIKFLQPSVDYKTAQIKQIIQRYPEHQFILIGDSGEHDPEVYAGIYQQFPKHIQAIKIRAVNGSDLSDKRFNKTFEQVPKSVWEVFKIPGENQ